MTDCERVAMGCGNGLLFQIEQNFSGTSKLCLKSKLSIRIQIILNSHRNKDNVQLPFSNAACPCELAVQ